MAEKHHFRYILFTLAAAVVLIVFLYALDCCIPHYRVSRATTWITHPLNPDGTVNYVLAMNQAAARGVTPANNAAVAIVRIIGTANLPGLRRNVVAHLKAIGVNRPPEHGAFTPFGAFLKRINFGIKDAQPAPGSHWARARRKYRQQLAIGNETQKLSIIRQPWIPAEHPVIARWLKSQQSAIHLIRRASKMPEFYAPMIQDHTGLIDYTIDPSAAIELIDFLDDAAMEQLGLHHDAVAWRDVMAMHRLAILIAGNYPGLIDLLVCMSGTVIADRLADRLSACQFIPATHLHGYLVQAETWKRPVELAAVINGAGRLSSLNLIQSLFKRQNHIAARQFGFRGFIPLHFGRAMAGLNRYTTKLASILRLPDYRKKAAQLRAFRRRIKDSSPHGWINEFVIRSPVSNLSRALLMPEFDTLRAEYSCRAERIITATTLALAEYRAVHRHYPASLGRLVPSILPHAPVDPFNTKPLHYVTNGTGYLLYCRRPNRRHRPWNGNPDAQRNHPHARTVIAFSVNWPAAPNPFTAP